MTIKTTTTTTTNIIPPPPSWYTETSYAQHWTKKQKLDPNNKTPPQLANETIFGSVWKDDYVIACTSKGWIYIWHIVNQSNSVNSTSQEYNRQLTATQNHHPLLKFQVLLPEQKQQQNSDDEVVELYGVHYSNGLLFVNGNQGILVTYQWSDIVPHLQPQPQPQEKNDNQHRHHNNNNKVLPKNTDKRTTTTTTPSCITMTPFAQYHLPYPQTGSSTGNNNNNGPVIIMDIDIDESQNCLLAATSNGGYQWNLHTTKLQSTYNSQQSPLLKKRLKRIGSTTTTTTTTCLNAIQVVSLPQPQDTNPTFADSLEKDVTCSSSSSSSSSNEDPTVTTRRVLTGGEDGMLRIWNGNTPHQDDDTPNNNNNNNKLIESIDILKQMKKADSSLIHDTTTTTTSTTSTTMTLSNASKCWISSMDVGKGTSSSEWWIIGGGLVVDTVDRVGASSRGMSHGRNQPSPPLPPPQQQKGFVVTIHGPTKSFMNGCITREIPQCILQTTNRNNNTGGAGLVTVGNECVVSHWSTLPLLQRYSRAWCSPPSVYTVAIRTPPPPGNHDEYNNNYDDGDNGYSMAIGGSGPYIDIFQGPHTKMLTLSIL